MGFMKLKLLWNTKMFDIFTEGAKVMVVKTASVLAQIKLLAPNYIIITVSFTTTQKVKNEKIYIYQIRLQISTKC